MAKVRINENELRKIIRESIQNVINEDNVPNYYEEYYGNRQPSGQDPIDPRAPGVSLTRDQADAKNAAANAALSSWNKLGTAGQIKAIQQLVGATPDGKMGPQTLGKIYVALRNGKSGLESVDFRPGRAGKYTNI
jgi:hypothetical protein